MIDLKEKVWDLSKWRFYQAEASNWIISNKFIDFLMLLGVVACIIIHFYAGMKYDIIKHVGIVIIIITYSVRISRANYWKGYFSGYEQGFEDSATGHIGYYDENFSRNTHYFKIETAINEIERGIEMISKEHKREIEDEIINGYKMLSGIGINFKKKSIPKFSDPGGALLRGRARRDTEKFT